VAGLGTSSSMRRVAGCSYPIQAFSPYIKQPTLSIAMTQKSQSTDAAIIGGGPVGSYAALQLSKLGIQATVFEEHPQIGAPSHCAGHISIRSLRNIGLYPLTGNIVENTFHIANFYSPQGTKFTLNLNTPVTCALNRERFDQMLAKKAEVVGAKFVLNTLVQSLSIQNGIVKGVNVRHADGSEVRVNSKVVFDCEGVSSRLLRQAGLRGLKPSGLVYAVETEIEGFQDVQMDGVEVYFGKAYAPGFYGWLIPRPDGTAKLGLATNRGNPKTYLNRLVSKHPVAQKQLANAKITSAGYHAIPLAGPISRSYTNGFLAIGDCASQVKPTTGGGVIFGLTAAKEAAEVAIKAIKTGDISAHALQAYQRRCNDIFNFDFRVMLRLRRFLNLLSDEKLDEMFRVVGKLGVDKALRDTDEIDFQGKLLLSAASKPQMLAALGYFGLLYLTTNP
jgi:digeranylgeranylglycerophospholipid reductase